jgi:hypothetical protein
VPGGAGIAAPGAKALMRRRLEDLSRRLDRARQPPTAKSLCDDRLRIGRRNWVAHSQCIRAQSLSIRVRDFSCGRNTVAVTSIIASWYCG